MAVPLHLPRTKDELEDALRDGIIHREGHHVDVKAALDSGDQANGKLAIDLASFAVDGGVIWFGIRERHDGKLEPAPVVLHGLKERIDQVAGSGRIDPPLRVTTHSIAGDEPGIGFLAVIIPASPDAPHMVDYVYRGRGDTTNIRLGDAEIRRIRASRQRRRADVEVILNEAIARDPTPVGLRVHAHMFMVATPDEGPGRMLFDAVSDDPKGWLRTALRSVPFPASENPWAPTMNNVYQIDRGSDGWAARSDGFGPGRMVRDDAREEQLIELEIMEDGAARLFCGRGTAHVRGAAGGGPRYVMDQLIPGLAYQFLVVVREIAETTRFLGNWQLGLAVENLAGALSWTVAFGGGSVIPFAGPGYRHTEEVTFAQLRDDPMTVVERLAGRLGRALHEGKVPLPRFQGQ